MIKIVKCEVDWIKDALGTVEKRKEFALHKHIGCIDSIKKELRRIASPVKKDSGIIEQHIIIKGKKFPM